MEDKKRVLSLLDSNYFCIMPWIHLHVTCEGIMSACMSLMEGSSSIGFGDLNCNSFEEIWQGEHIRKFRRRLLSGKKSFNCKKCYDREKVGFWSQRLEANKKYAEYIDWVVNTDEEGFAPDAKPIYWDIRISNKCNLKCRMCSFYSSSAWYEDSVKLDFVESPKSHERIHGIKDTKVFFNSIKHYIGDLKMIHIAGGEPFLHEENKQILNWLIDAKNYDIEIKYNTNLKVLDQEYIELWKYFHNVNLWVSIDGIGAQCEYIRKNIKFETLLNHLDILKEKSNVKLHCDITVSVFNIMTLTDFSRWAIESGYFLLNHIVINLLYMPEYLNMQILPLKMKQDIILKIKDHIQWLENQHYIESDSSELVKQFQTCIEYIIDKDLSELIPKFLQITNSLDEIRKENYLEIFPELHQLTDD